MSIKDKDRVADYGEVFTSEKEVNAMLDLVYNETQRIDSRFLEPACGNGNFLSEVLKRKLSIVDKKYKENQVEFERYIFIAVSSIYGIDILQDNIEECRQRLLDIVLGIYQKKYQKLATNGFIESLQYVLSLNILWGDVLTLKKPNSQIPIKFSQWSFISGNLIKRSDYTLHTLLENQPMEGNTLFSYFDEQVFIPKPIKEFKPVKFWEVFNSY